MAEKDHNSHVTDEHTKAQKSEKYITYTASNQQCWDLNPSLVSHIGQFLIQSTAMSIWEVGRIFLSFSLMFVSYYKPSLLENKYTCFTDKTAQWFILLQRPQKLGQNSSWILVHSTGREQFVLSNSTTINGWFFNVQKVMVLWGIVSEDMNLNTVSALHSLRFPLNPVTSRSSIIFECGMVYISFHSLPVVYFSWIISYHSLLLALGTESSHQNWPPENFGTYFYASCFLLITIFSAPNDLPVIYLSPPYSILLYRNSYPFFMIFAKYPVLYEVFPN